MQFRASGAKIDDVAKFRNDMLSAIDKLELTDEMARDILSDVNANVVGLKRVITANFDAIFQVK